MKLDINWVCEVTDGYFTGVTGASKKIESISYNTRTMTPGALFIAIQGENADGHDYIGEAFKKGAAAVISEKDCEGVSVIRVDNSKKALLKLGAAYRNQFNIPIVGVTGSSGKTTTKEFIFSVLSKKYNTLKSEGNMNSEIGLPVSLLRLEDSHTAAVFEMGMRGLGEIHDLSICARPTIAAITNIGTAHIERLGTRENILKAKMEITDGLSGTLILNGDDEYLNGISRPDTIRYAIDAKADISAGDIKTEGNRTYFKIYYDGKSIDVNIPIGRHNIMNSLCAFAVGYILDVKAEQIAEGLLNYSPAEMRQVITQIKGVTFINDCYNANLDSMQAALKVLAEMKANRRIAVLGDMLELGEFSAEAHETVKRLVKELGIDIFIGTEIYGFNYKNNGEIANELLSVIKEGDAVLIKASRGKHFEEISRRILNE